jgi:hypothetical protein
MAYGTDIWLQLLWQRQHRVGIEASVDVLEHLRTIDCISRILVWMPPEPKTSCNLFLLALASAKCISQQPLNLKQLLSQCVTLLCLWVWLWLWLWYRRWRIRCFAHRHHGKNVL